MNPLETYIRELREIRSSGEAVPETSYYGALATLFNEVGKSLKPGVRCIINLRNRGAGIPDGGLFTLNDVACWRNVPAKVWGYTIGGYQVIKKWLSYRERELLGRALTPDEAREVMNIARRIAAILLLEPALDANYEAVKLSNYAWPAG